MKRKHNKTRAAAVERYQWMRNAEHKPPFGIHGEIRVLDHAGYREHIVPRLRFPRLSLVKYRTIYPSVTHYILLRVTPEAEWMFQSAGSLVELRPSPSARPYVVKVTEFAGPNLFRTGPHR
jgi:hypothetical protein